MRRAARISTGAHKRAMRMTSPGGTEYEIEAELLHEFRRYGAQAPAYTPIVAGGANACVLHDVQNNAPLRDGELLLIDAGCELDGYASDITRTFPVSGAFAPAQRDVYQMVLAAQTAAIAVVRRLIADLGRDLWSHQEDTDESSNIKDLLLPTLVGLIKAMLMLGFGYYLIRLMGDEDLLGRILAGIGILTLGASLAAQDAIKNYFGTLLLASERPFRIGDRVTLDKVEGIIERVGYRSTRVRTEKGSLVTIPNFCGFRRGHDRGDHGHFTGVVSQIAKASASGNREIWRNRSRSHHPCLVTRLGRQSGPFGSGQILDAGRLGGCGPWFGDNRPTPNPDLPHNPCAGTGSVSGLTLTPPQTPTFHTTHTTHAARVAHEVAK